MSETSTFVYTLPNGVESEFFAKSKQENGKIYCELYDASNLVTVTSVGFYLNTETDNSFLYHGVPFVFKCKLENGNLEGDKRYFDIPAQGQFTLIQQLFYEDNKIGEWKSYF